MYAIIHRAKGYFGSVVSFGLTLRGRTLRVRGMEHFWWLGLITIFVVFIVCIPLPPTSIRLLLLFLFSIKSGTFARYLCMHSPHLILIKVSFPYCCR